MNGKSLNITDQKLAVLRGVLPEAFAEGKVDWEKLRVMLTRDGVFDDERYHLNWAGKTDAYRALQSPTSATLAPCREQSVDFDGAAHVFIEGENLAVLKALQKAYFGKVKMIYIDPPYNTGNDHFIYPDRFAESKKDYQKRVGDMDAAGRLTREGLFRKNSRENGHYHSNWLSMMYPRLFLARNLLREDGVIFVSIDDNEAHNLRLVMNEIFGEENFVGNAIRVSSASQNISNYMSIMHDYTLVYCKDKNMNLGNWEVHKNNYEEFEKRAMSLFKQGLSTQDIQAELRALVKYPRFYDFDHYNYCDQNGVYQTVSAGGVESGNNDSVVIHPKTKRPCKIPAGGWRYKADKIKEITEKNLWHFGSDENTIPRVKLYLKDYLKQSPKGVNFFDSQKDVRFLKENGIPFDFPKPVAFIKRLLEMVVGKDEIILDFFAGSCTTAHAVLDLNAEDGGNRQFICVQMPEACDEKSEAHKAGYATIADIGKERIRRVIAGGKLNAGLKVFKLRESNFKPWRGDVKDADELAAQMQLHTDPLVDGAQTEDILYELLLKSGVPLTASMQDNDGWWLAEDVGAKIAVALTRIDAATVADILAAEPTKVIALDRLFQGDDQLKTNTALQMGDAGLGFDVV